MGKSKRKLINALRECYEHKDDDDDLMEEPMDLEYEKEECLIDTAFLIRNRLIRYTEEGAYPLCEFLDYDNVENFLRWVLLQNS